MSLLKLAWIGVRRRALSSALTILYVGLGAALALLVAAVRGSTERSFHDAARGYDLLLAPQNGSGLEAALATLFYVDQPKGTLPWSAYEAALKDERVQTAVPYAMGDSFGAYRVVGTTEAHFRVLADAQRRPIGEGVTGRLFAPDAFEAVVGSLAARSGGLGLGDEIRVSHGSVAGGHEHRERWRVVGILRPTGTPQDRALFIPLESFYHIEGHEEAAGAPVPGGAADHDGEHGEEHGTAHAGERALSAVGLKLVSRSAALGLETYFDWRRDGHGAQAVRPTDEVEKLLSGVIAPVDTAFRWAAVLVLLVGALGILVGLYNTLQGRRREIAVLRALGARPVHVFTVILLEALLLCVLGGLLGLLLGHGVLALLAPTALADYGVRVDAEPGLLDLLLLGGLVVLGALAGFLPAWRGLRTPVAANLAPGDA